MNAVASVNTRVTIVKYGSCMDWTRPLRERSTCARLQSMPWQPFRLRLVFKLRRGNENRHTLCIFSALISPYARNAEPPWAVEACTTSDIQLKRPIRRMARKRFTAHGAKIGAQRKRLFHFKSGRNQRLEDTQAGT